MRSSKGVQPPLSGVPVLGAAVSDIITGQIIHWIESVDADGEIYRLYPHSFMNCPLSRTRYELSREISMASNPSQVAITLFEMVTCDSTHKKPRNTFAHRCRQHQNESIKARGVCSSLER